MSLTACEKDFLEAVPSNSVPAEEVNTTKEGMEAALTGIIRLMRQAPVNQGAVSHDSYGVPAMMLTFDVMGQDVMANTNWYVYQYELDNKLDTYRGTRILWGHSYNLITNANSIIANAKNLTDANDQEKATFEAEAKVIRAFSYFNLARVYQHTYLKDKNAPAVPLMLEPTTPTTQGKERATLEQVYSQILADLIDAEQALTSGRPSKSRINKNVAQGLLARVYLEMGQWEKAAEFARKARTGYPLMTSTEYQAGFNNYGNAEWIWGLPQSADQNSAYASFYSFIDGRYTVLDDGSREYVRRGYNNFRANDKFVELFDENDVRREFQEDEEAFTLNSKGEKIWSYDRFTITKFKDLANLGGHIPLMRSAEMLLIEAEAQARLNNPVEAQLLLLELRQQRYEAGTVVLPTLAIGDALLEEIYVERRKELYGEGFGLFDIKRLQKPLLREGNHTAVLGVTPANSDLFIHQLPQGEMDANPNAEQNP
ncbi:RagB/SusD family nutrient uptake outer membrane protein [Pontibacter sp. HSC-14F20]|uniref:RagB/SusD family nutrient uptake outer membrane protein n=1 Tax=Pontibacter sp. HSC-14F20 TaxID=2864136 RepID=UPI001C73AD75|nr:RagB/SusD family nutrient uptake outer membrane protein [Pontibacter sp. HSC-14F20]MBX0333495.1 RagB/SusD family nutrient uptake outer membrane protein [Pontibacter sp. HSC-14F20]